MEVIEVNGNTLVFKYQEANDQPNVTYFYGTERAVLVDAGPSPRFAKDVLRYLHDRGLREPDYIIITHYHWDHTFGLSGYSGLSIGTEYTNERLAALKALDFKKDDFVSDLLINEYSIGHLNTEYPEAEGIEVAVCDKAIGSERNIDLGGITLTAAPVPSQHSDGALVVKCGDVLVVGDAANGEIVGTEFVERPEKMRDFLEIMELADFATVISGHDVPTDKAAFMADLAGHLQGYGSGIWL